MSFSIHCAIHRLLSSLIAITITLGKNESVIFLSDLAGTGRGSGRGVREKGGTNSY